ncbi:MAG: hypothetical protein R3C40_05590 [Parvularculaceae bacterium]
MKKFLFAAASAALLAAGAASAADLAEVKDRGTVRVAVAVLSPFVILGEDGSKRL